MSRSTSAVWESAKSDQSIVGTRSDKAVCCLAKMPRGYCKKLLVTPQGDLVCPNGHHMPLEFVRDKLLADSVRDDLEWVNLGLITVRDPDTWRQILQRLCSPDFMAAGPEDWRTYFLFKTPDRFTHILQQADRYDRQAAKVLRDYWERHMRQADPLIGNWLDAQASVADRLVCREQALRVYASWHSVYPEGLLAKFELLAQAAAFLKNPVARAYRKNVENLTYVLMNPDRPTYYFHCETQDEYYYELHYNVLLDPTWTSKIFTRDGAYRRGDDNQLALRYLPHRQEIKWHFQHTADPQFTEWFFGRFKNGRTKAVNGLLFSHDDTDRIDWFAAKPEDKITGEDDYDRSLQVVEALMNCLNLWRGLPQGF